MTPQEQYELKLSALRITDGDIEKAKAIYAWLTETGAAPAADAPAPSAEKTKADKPKADKPKAEKPKAEDPPAETPKPTDAEAPALDYKADVLPKIVGAVSRLTTGGATPDAAKAAIVALLTSKYGVANAKDTKPEQWAALIADLATVQVSE